VLNVCNVIISVTPPSLHSVIVPLIPCLDLDVVINMLS
jgi:hypothetical protein